MIEIRASRPDRANLNLHLKPRNEKLRIGMRESDSAVFKPLAAADEVDDLNAVALGEQVLRPTVAPDDFEVALDGEPFRG